METRQSIINAIIHKERNNSTSIGTSSDNTEEKEPDNSDECTDYNNNNDNKSLEVNFNSMCNYNYIKHTGEKNLDYFMTSSGEKTACFSQDVASCYSNDSNASLSIASVPLLDYQEGLIRVSSKESFTQEQFNNILSEKFNKYKISCEKLTNI